MNSKSYDAIASFRLLRRLALRPDESWPSFFHRIAQHNYLHAPSALLVACQERFRGEQINDQILLPTKAEAFTLLAQLTWLSEDELYEATAHTFAPNIVPVGRAVQEVTMPTGLKRPLIDNVELLTPLEAVKYCPVCLREEQYHRIAWLPRLAAVCTKHLCLLESGCPACSTNLSLPALLDGHCPACQMVLASVEARDVSDDDIGLLSQQQLQHWLCNQSISAAGMYAMVDLLPRAACHLLHDIASVNELVDLAPRKLPDLSVMNEQFVRVKVAFTSLLNWPQGFHELLNDYRVQVRERRIPSGPATDLGPLYRRLLRRWQHEVFAPVHHAFDDYLVMSYDLSYKVRKAKWYLNRPHVASRFRYITYTETASILGVAPQTLSKLARQGRLRRFRAQDSDHWLFERAEVERLAAAWSATLSLEEAAAALGLSRAVVRDLIEIEELEAERGPTVDEAPKWQLSEGSVAMWRVAINEQTLPLEALEGVVVDLVTAAQMLAVVGLNVASTLQLVRTGDLPAYSSLVQKPGELLFRERDVLHLVEVIKYQQGWVDRETVARRMGVKVSVVTKWTRAGLLSPVIVCGPAQYFDAEAMDEFVQGHVFSEAAAAMLGVGRLTVQRWARQGKLKPVSGPNVDGCLRYLFRRAEIEAWCDDDIVSAPELARRLGMSHSQVLVWTHQGKLKPVSGPGVDHCKQYLFRYPVR